MRLLIAIMLLYSITPGLSEVVETGVHLVVHHDLAHHDSEGRGEHSCTPLAHHCGSHVAMAAQQCSRVADTVAFDTTTLLDPTSIAARLGRVTGPPPVPPPIA